MTPEQAAREFVKATRDESGPAHDPQSLLVGFLAGAAWEREACAKLAESTEVEGGYTGYNGEESFWESDAEATLQKVAAAIRARTQAATEGR